MNWIVKKKVNVVNSSQNEVLSPSGKALSFDGFGSMSLPFFGFHPMALTVFTFFPISNFLEPSITGENWVVEMRIWCIKIFSVLVLHFNPWVEVFAGGLLIPEGLYSPVGKYLGTCIKIRIWIELSRKKSKFCKFISKRKIIFLRHSSILRRLWMNFIALSLVLIQRLLQFSHFSFVFPNFFDMSINKDTWIVKMHICCINIVNICFTFNPLFKVPAGGLLISWVSIGQLLNTSVLALKYKYELNSRGKKANFVNYSQNEGLYLAHA
jgi:hypothetical protein